MGTAKHWRAAAAILALASATCVPAADFELTPAETQRIAARGLVLRATLDASQRRGTVRAAIGIDAAPAIVFGMMTRCADALQYVPHLRACRVRDHAADGSWMLIDHEIDFGWYAPRIRYQFRADLITDLRIVFKQVSGDFKTNEGIYELEPDETGQHTLLRYRAYIDPPGYVPNWLARSAFKRELPQMLTDLRKRCEAEQARQTQANASPH